MARKKLQAKNQVAAGRLGSLRFDRRSATPLYRQVYDRLQEMIARGGFGPGSRLPSSRSLASQLTLSRATVAYAYDLLAGDGRVGGRGQAGTFVSPKGGAEAASAEVRAFGQPRERADLVRPFEPDIPALDLFPRKTWARLEKRRAAALAVPDLLAPDPLGYLPLRRTIANRLAITRGILCDAEQVFVTAGYEGALLMAGLALLEPGDSVWVEDPGDPATPAVLRSLRMSAIGLPVDAGGMDVGAGIRRASRARLAVVAPCHAFPLGTSLRTERRDMLMAWAKRAGAWILEDDRGSDFYYGGQPPSALKSTDADDRVIHAANFGRLLFPGFRLCCLVVPRRLVAAFGRVAAALPCQPALREQVVLREFIRLGFIGRHLNQMRRQYSARRDVLCSALEKQSLLRLDAPVGGLHVIGWMRSGRSDADAAARAFQDGLGAKALSACTAGKSTRPALLLGFAGLPEAEAESSVRRLLRAIDS